MLNRRLTSGVLVFVATVALVLALIGHLDSLTSPDTSVKRFQRVVDDLSLDLRLEELLFTVATIALAAVSYRMSGQPRAKHWWALTGVFGLLLGVKTSGAFWRLENSLRSLDTSTGWHGWQPSSLIVITIQTVMASALMLFFFRWVQTLQSCIRWRILVSGTLFVLGAVAAEALTERLWTMYGSASLQYVLADTVEDILESAGLVVFIDALAVQFVSMTDGQELRAR